MVNNSLQLTEHVSSGIHTYPPLRRAVPARCSRVTLHASDREYYRIESLCRGILTVPSYTHSLRYSAAHKHDPEKYFSSVIQ